MENEQRQEVNYEVKSGIHQVLVRVLGQQGSRFMVKKRTYQTVLYEGLAFYCLCEIGIIQFNYQCRMNELSLERCAYLGMNENFLRFNSLGTIWENVLGDQSDTWMMT